MQTQHKEMPASQTPRMRPLPIALAHALARAKVSDQHRQDVLGRLFRALPPVDQFRCRAELMDCRAAKRGELLAEVV